MRSSTARSSTSRSWPRSAEVATRSPDVALLEPRVALTAALLRETVRLSADLKDAWHLVYGVAGLAGWTARQAEPGRAARLLGAAEALSETMGMEVPGSTWRDLDHDAHRDARLQLGDEAYDREWFRGRTMLTLEQAAAEALHEVE
jgi:hypothetical protein